MVNNFKLYKSIKSQIKRKFDNILFEINKVKLKKGEKINVVFLFQIASFWPSWESFWEECLKDERLNVTMVYYDIKVGEFDQTETAVDFLKSKNINYVNLEDYDFNNQKPHIIVLQSPYDGSHRQKDFHSRTLKVQGIRIIYISYGIEISDREGSRILHFVKGVPGSAWRIYTYSDLIKQDFLKYSLRKDIENTVKVTGHPKFDGLFHKEKFPFPADIKQKAKGRKIVLWKVHFPTLLENHVVLRKNMRFITPYFEEYEKFINQIDAYSDLFFVFMPHPKFFSQITEKSIYTAKHVNKLKDKLNSIENLCTYYEDDYRPVILGVDAVIVDRSAVMIEAAVNKKPILYMHNSDCIEPLTEVALNLVNSYYQGTGCDDMLNFLELIRKAEDPKKEERLRAIKEFIPNFDGNAGKRIKEDMIKSIQEEIKFESACNRWSRFYWKSCS
ncbi:MAG: CDP-glycerol glycerophosphotransferase family protein [Bacteroidales bacterium]|nr:CDP-glycerol glycerophosphotransferase family protein [Bacteroidales bacterium]